MKKIFFFFLIVISFSFITHEQTENAKQTAQSQIIQLKQGTLLVRLYDKHKVLQALEEKGMKQRAQTIKSNQLNVNKEIIKAFSNFSFCKVLFFYSSDSENLLNRDYSKLKLFTDTTFSEQAMISIDSNFFVADFGYLPGVDKSRIETSSPKFSVNKKQKKYKGNTVYTKIKCMYLRDNKLRPLKEPFPLYVRFHPTPIKKLTYEDVVKKMNLQLYSYFVSVEKK